MDARDLSTFSDQSFDLVWFSFNGIDYVNHIDRLTILQEIYRVTKPGAILYFLATTCGAWFQPSTTGSSLA